MEYVNWIAANWDNVLTIAGSLCMIASAVCAVTKTRDSKFYKVIELIALQIGRAKDVGAEGISKNPGPGSNPG